MKKTIKLTIITIAIGLSHLAFANLADRINQAALDTNNSKNLYRESGKVLLYGTQTNGADTNGGKWACAKVVHVVLKQAGALGNLPVPIRTKNGKTDYRMGIATGVSTVEKGLSGWKKITDESDVQPGDVVVWTNRLKGKKDKSCTGSGTCHIGIYTSRGYFHNNPLGDSPTFGGLGLYLFSFKVAFRPN